MSARSIFDDAPLGAIVQFSDGAARPPARFRKKVAAWENHNGRGRLVRKAPAHTVGNHTSPASFGLHLNDYASAGVVVLKVFKTFSVDSALTFAVVERPAPGSVRVLDRPGDKGELIHLARNRADAETWLKSHGYPDAVLDEVGDDAVVAAACSGRAA
ncbi:hypothetical protein V4R08_16630 (plasmid) [Nitrobacter sp. NHB1]|uniref:hypothetical protein n=1 Tax=Nitrobacter sp. NHB1 TaxID=3119830 RepID=UPI003000F06F